MRGWPPGCWTRLDATRSGVMKKNSASQRLCALGVAAVSGRPLDANLNGGLLAAFLLYVVLNVMTGVALGALVHNSAAPIVASFILPFGFGLLGRTSQFVARWLDYWNIQLAAQRPVVRSHHADPGFGGPLGGDTTGRRTGLDGAHGGHLLTVIGTKLTRSSEHGTPATVSLVPGCRSSTPEPKPAATRPTSSEQPNELPAAAAQFVNAPPDHAAPSA